MLLADIYSRDYEVPRHNRRAFETLEKALEIAQSLAWKGGDVHKADLEQMLNLFMMVCFRLKKDYDPYEKIIKVRLLKLGRMFCDSKGGG